MNEKSSGEALPTAAFVEAPKSEISAAVAGVASIRGAGIRRTSIRGAGIRRTSIRVAAVRVAAVRAAVHRSRRQRAERIFRVDAEIAHGRCGAGRAHWTRSAIDRTRFFADAITNGSTHQNAAAP